MAFRSVKEFLDLGGSLAPTPAERAVIRAVQAGEPCVLSMTRPEAATPDNTVRATLLRLLITGATPDCGTQDYGVRVEGAWITGELDLGFAKARGLTALCACHFGAAPQFPDAELNQLSLDASHLPGLFAQGLRLRGSLFLRGVKAKGTVDVGGAKIGGQLDCEGAELDGAGGWALGAQGVETGEGLFLRGVKAKGTVAVNGAKIGGQLDCEGAELDGAGGWALKAQGVETGQSLFLSGVKAKGTVDVNAAKIGGQLSCVGAELDGPEVDGKRDMALNAQGAETGEGLFLRGVKAKGTVAVNGAKIGGQLSCAGAELDGAGGWALDAQRLYVTQGLIWRDVTVTSGVVSMSAAQVSDLADDGRWPVGVDALIFDGFTYDRISGNTAPVTAGGRRGGLRAGSVWQGRFWPQPYTQLARAFRAMGHGGEARTVLY